MSGAIRADISGNGCAVAATREGSLAMLDDVFDSPADVLTTPFEDWCCAEGIHPEAFGAWDLYARTLRPQGTLAS
jgi:hypothetical protein